MDNPPSLSAPPIFREGHHALQLIDDGVTFPKILLPRSPLDNGVASLVQGITSSSEWLQQELCRHSAILFRGFSLQSAEDFAAVSQAFGWEPMKYEGMALRREVLSGIYTANECPAESEIWMHHEMQSGGSYPSKILFFCEIEPGKAGETPIVLSHRATERIKVQFPAFMDTVEVKRLLYTGHIQSHDDQSSMIGKGWQAIFDTKDEVEAEKRAAARYKATIEWLPDKTAKFTQGPLPATMSFREDGRKVWFNNILGGYKSGKKNVTYADGSELPAEAVYGCARIMQEEAVAIPWRKGDVLVLDNLEVLHGKRPAEPPRRILVSLYK